MLWKKLSKEQIKESVFAALGANRNYDTDYILGIPGSYLNTGQFHRDAEFLEDAPYLKTFINNPNHIGCHTLTGDKGEDLFRGTQRLEVEVIRIAAEEILNAPEKSIDGYVAPGGTEANIQAMWLYRNYYQKEFRAKNHEIGVVFSSDSHYSFYKGCNILSLQPIPVEVDNDTRTLNPDTLRKTIQKAQVQGVKYFVLNVNMSTTLFGSVDELAPLTRVFRDMELPYKVHVDGAFGGFIYPFSKPDHELDFRNPEITSIAMDAHKMLMAPYGTGIFLVRKGWMEYAATSAAKYVQGLDYTLVGSRNGAQAVAIWMILQTHGPEGWKAEIDSLLAETSKLCNALDEAGITYYRNPHMNIVSMHAEKIPADLPEKYRLVADDFAGAQWWKIVVMPHTKGHVIDSFIRDLKEGVEN